MYIPEITGTSQQTHRTVIKVINSAGGGGKNRAPLGKEQNSLIQDKIMNIYFPERILHYYS